VVGSKGFGVEFLDGLWNTHTFSESAIDQNINTIRGIVYTISHTIKDKEKLVLRAKRVQGQVEALARALDEERDCSDILQLMSAARGAMNSLMAELLEGHIRNHVLNEKKSNAGQTSAAEEVIKMVKSYLK
jgi:DNA-binding FrmR family transcriptional regulator